MFIGQIKKLDNIDRQLSASDLVAILGQAGFNVQADSSAVDAMGFLLQPGARRNIDFGLIKPGLNADGKSICDKDILLCLGANNMIQDVAAMVHFNVEEPDFCLDSPHGYSWKNEKGEWFGLWFRSVNNKSAACIQRATGNAIVSGLLCGRLPAQ